jgi:predicted lipid-binding transport protein (Tim44 family)
MKRKSLLPLLFAAVLSFTVGVHDADAKRIGGGGSMGRQSQSIGKGQASPAPTAPQQAPQGAGQRPGQQPTTAPAPAGNRWLGPIAGLAAGLGIAALLSHFGLGGAMADMIGSFLMIGLVILAVVMLFRFLRNRSAGGAKPAFAGGEPQGFQRNLGDAPPANARTTDAPSAFNSNAGGAGNGIGNGLPAEPTWSIPADMNVAEFTHAAQVLFLRLQAASDAGNLADIREFTTPEMYAEIQMEINGRNGAANVTEVFKLEPQLLGVEEINGVQLASVRFTGTIRENVGAHAERFSEVWNFAKGTDGRWLLAGIQQTA